MTTSAAVRSDIHRPSAPEFDPAAYELIDVYDLHPESGDHRALGNEIDKLAARGIVQAPHSNGCGHCGQTNLRYVALLVREDVREWIFVGQDCLGARFLDQTKASFDALRKAAQLDREAQRCKKFFEALCEGHPEFVWATYADHIRQTGGNEYAAWALNTAYDIATEARQYGQASDKQIALVCRLISEIEEKAAQYVPPVQSGDVPTGRVQIEGIVLGAPKWYDNSFGGSWKMTVKLDNGSRVWGTVPTCLLTTPQEYDDYVGPAVGAGDRVRFTATVKPRELDFGWYSRPANAELLAPAS